MHHPTVELVVNDYVDFGGGPVSSANGLEVPLCNQYFPRRVLVHYFLQVVISNRNRAERINKMGKEANHGKKTERRFFD